ncbi:MAG: hypothetical protein GWO02_05390, partial [Gammaproteobacteria bacterium]|nr:hypothetical protein [Gammaproteobacteria bacterium]
AAEARLPRVTGYIVVGIIVGPEVARLVTDADVERLKVLDDLAISLIALSAGGELRLRDLRRRGRMLLGIMSA